MQTHRYTHSKPSSDVIKICVLAFSSDVSTHTHTHTVQCKLSLYNQYYRLSMVNDFKHCYKPKSASLTNINTTLSIFSRAIVFTIWIKSSSDPSLVLHSTRQCFCCRQPPAQTAVLKLPDQLKAVNC